jgi:hypothetical protein
MTHEQRAAWIRRTLFVLFWIGLAVWYFSPRGEDKEEAGKKANNEQASAGEGNEAQPGVLYFMPPKDAGSEEILALLEEEAARRGRRIPCVIAVHFHTPGQADSEDIADSLNRIDVKYCKQVLVVRVDVTTPLGGRWAVLETATRTPDVLLTAARQRADRIQGAMPYPKIEKKIDLLLFGLERAGRDWRPEVKGMQRASSSR